MRQPGFDDSSADEGDAHPAMAAHERGRKLPQKSKPTEALLGERKTQESKVPVEKRLIEFPGHSLIKDSIHGNIFCRCCKKGDIKNIKGTINTHVTSPTHHTALEAWRAKQLNDTDVKEFLID